MTKLELNDKLAELYNIDPYINPLNLGKRYLIDDWSRLMDLAVDNGINYVCYKHHNYCKAWIGVMSDDSRFAFVEELSCHESPKAAVRFAIAMALVKLKEDK